jgi:S-adenosylmethionine-diacylglycerol 3-amino-3-carboxypropyl transferase
VETTSAELRDRVRFDAIRYACCWEDAAVLCRALAPVEGARCLSIAAAGDNVFSLLAAGARSVVAVDLSPAQLALVELKARAFGALAHAELLGFLGARAAEGRWETYRRLRGGLTDSARGFWDERRNEIEAGVLHAGKFERYLRAFGRWVVPLAHGRGTVAELLTPRSRAERERFYAERWDSWRWRLAFRLFFGRWMQGRFGRDPEFLRHVEGSVPRRMLARTRRGFTALPTESNPYVQYIMRGEYGAALPDYLRPENHAKIANALDRLQLVAGSVDEVAARLPAGSIDAFNLSDIFEYLDTATYHAVLESLLRVAAPGARFAYWNLFVERSRPESLAHRLAPRDAAARRLHAADRAFFYQRLVVEVAR